MEESLPGQHSQIPVYRQIANVLRAQIVSDVDPSRRRLPCEQELAKAHGVARNTVRCALEVLEKEGLIVRTPGQPTLINPEGIRVYQRLRHRRVIVVLVTLGVNVAVPQDYFGQIYQGILAAGEEAGYRCALRWIEGKFKPVDTEPQMVDPEDVLGAINLFIPDRGLIATYVNVGVPVVCVDFWPVYPGADGVVVDCFAEAHQAVEFLQAHGHRELFYVGNVLGMGSNRQREIDSLFMETGYQRAVLLAGMNDSAGRVFYCRSDEPHDLVEWFLSLRPRPTAGIIFDRVLLKAFCEALLRHDIRCPKDVSLMCKTHLTDPEDVASIRTDACALGRFATQLLLRRAAGEYGPGMRVAFESQVKPGPTVRHVTPDLA